MRQPPHSKGAEDAGRLVLITMPDSHLHPLVIESGNMVPGHVQHHHGHVSRGCKQISQATPGNVIYSPLTTRLSIQVLPAPVVEC